MWICAPLISLLLSPVLSSCIPRRNSEQGLFNAVETNSLLGHDTLRSNTTIPVAQGEEDWVCGPTYVFGSPFPPFTGTDKAKPDTFVPQNTALSGSTRQPCCEKTEGLDSPGPGGLGAWAKHVMERKNVSLTIDLGEQLGYASAAMYLPWGGAPFLATVSGLEGCTSVVLACDCGIYITHHWEVLFKQGNDLAFSNLVLDALKAESSDRDSWMGVPMLPSGCFTASTRLNALIFSRTTGTIKEDGTSDPRRLSTVPSYPQRLQQIKDTLGNALNIGAETIGVQLYTRKEGMRDGDDTTAMGKILVSYNPDVDNNQRNPRTGYEVWAGAVLEKGVPTVADSDVHEPIMRDFWT